MTTETTTVPAAAVDTSVIDAYLQSWNETDPAARAGQPTIPAIGVVDTHEVPTTAQLREQWARTDTTR